MRINNYTNNVTNAGEYSLADLLGGKTSSSNITPNNALNNSDIVHSVVNIIASTIAKMPLNLFEDTENGKSKVNNEVSYLLKTRANEYVSAIDFKQALITNMLLHGNGYALINTKRGVPTELILLESTKTRLEKINNKLFVITNVDNKEYKVKYEQVIHIKDLSEDGINGVSRISVLKNKLNNRAEADNMLGNMYSNGGTGAIKGVLNVPANLNGEAKRKLKEGFVNVLNSDSSGIAVLSDGISLQPIQKMSLTDQQFINAMKLNKEDICAVYGVPVSMVGSTEGTSYNNLTEMTRNFVQSLVPMLNKLEQELDFKLLTTDQRYSQYFKFNMSVALRSSDLDRVQFYKDMFRNGFMMADEIRELEDMNHLPDGLGQIFYRDLNLVEVGFANEYQAGKAGVNTQPSTVEGGEE